MAIEIKGFIPVTMLDWKGKLASTVFLPGCNFRCPFCQNPELVTGYEKLPSIPEEMLFSHLLKRKGWLDGVVVCGGEPTIHRDLIKLLEKIEDFGYPVKIDTNGSHPEVLARLIEQGLVSAVAMDIKTSFSKYSLTVKKSVKIEKIIESIKLLMRSNIEYEFRTTVVPGYVDRQDVLDIARHIRGAKLYVLQQFNPKTVLSPAASEIKPLTARELLEIAEECREYVLTETRGG